MKTIAATAIAVVMTTISYGSPEVKADRSPFQSSFEPVFYVDYANFRGFEQDSYVEFYLHIAYQDLQFIQNGEQFEAGYVYSLDLLNEKEELVEQHQISDVFNVRTFDETIHSGMARASLVGYSLQPGRYILRSELRDMETSKVSKIEQYVTVRDFAKQQLQVSDVQFSHRIEDGTEGEPYVKNGRYIQPNALRTFAHGLSNVFFYFEVYNLSTAAEDDAAKYVTHFIFKDEGGETAAHIRRPHTKPGADAAHSLQLPVESFLRGRYTLTVKVEDLDSHEVAEVTSDFHIFSDTVTMTDFDYAEYYK